MNTTILLTQIQDVAAAITILCFLLYLFRKRRATPLWVIHPILFGSQLTAAVFCACLALRAGLETEIDLLRFWLGACGAIFALLSVLLSYRTLWFKFVETSTRPPWSASGVSAVVPEKPVPPAPVNLAEPGAEKPPAPATDRIFPDHGLTS